MTTRTWDYKKYAAGKVSRQRWFTSGELCQPCWFCASKVA